MYGDTVSSKSALDFSAITLPESALEELEEAASGHNMTQLRRLLDQIDMLAIRNSTATEYESYDELQSEVGSLQAVATGAQQTLKKLPL